MSSAHAAVRMVARPESVPAARRFVSDALTLWGRERLVEDVELCASELVTNATLHSGGTYFHIELEENSGAVHLAVADTGMGAVDVLARQPDLSDALFDDLNADDAAATGRGMFLVSALAAAWGIDELPAGKRVWAEFRTDPTGHETASTAPRVTRSSERPTPVLDPDEWPVVRFLGCPAALLIAHDDNLAAYTRELYLIGGRLGEPSFEQLAAVLDGYVAQHATNWDPARIIAHEAVREGRELVDFAVLADKEIRPSIQFLRSLIWEAEALSRQGKLMTLPAAEPVQRLRDWLEGEFLEQIEDGREPLSYPDWLSGAQR
jgi:anti-sigma regulatory factor (Ser/Thr protein kinase)